MPLPAALGGNGAYAMLSSSPGTDTAVIFVHGFGGDPLKTWLNFPAMVDDPSTDPWWEGCDLYFFKYESVRKSTSATADRLIKEVQRVFPNPDPTWFRAARKGLPRDLEIVFLPNEIRDIRPPPHDYKHLVLVGHSEGGFVLRRLVLNALGAAPTQPLLQAKLRLFAPALFGASPSGVKGFFAEVPGLRALGQMFFGSSVAYRELRADSPILPDIRDRTVAAAGRNPDIGSLSAGVLWGEDDEILLQGEYACDQRYATQPGHDHSSICKPNAQFVVPLEFVSG